MESLLCAVAGCTGDVLDAGCGSGETARYMAERGCRVLAVDVALQVGLHGRRESCGAGVVEWMQEDFRTASQRRMFDAVALLNVLHRADDAETTLSFLEHAVGCLRRRGLLALSWITDDIPPDEPCYLPSKALVRDHLASRGLTADSWWEVEVEHRHASWLNGALHRHSIVYSTWIGAGPRA